MENIKNEMNNILFESIHNDNKIIDNLKNNLHSESIKKRHQHISWILLHSFSVFYPIEPTEIEKNNTKNFIKVIKHRLPFCSACSNNKNDKFIENYNLDIAISTRDELVNFFIKYHSYINKNFVNLEYDDSIYTIEYIINKYTSTDYRQYIKNIYNIDLNEIITNSIIDNYGDNLKIILDRVRFKIIDEIKNSDFVISISIKNK